VTQRGEKTVNGKLIFEVHPPATHLLITCLAPLRRGFFLALGIMLPRDHKLNGASEARPSDNRLAAAKRGHQTLETIRCGPVLSLV